ncbi:uncharacterized protein [Anser cygnoides]|uniref:uncharacterized protein isoform X2 n=1 Tax=Anser cygnoides TaxID=8845 RepID=UPI0034D205EE
MSQAARPPPLTCPPPRPHGSVCGCVCGCLRVCAGGDPPGPPGPPGLRTPAPRLPPARPVPAAPGAAGSIPAAPASPSAARLPGLPLHPVWAEPPPVALAHARLPRPLILDQPAARVPSHGIPEGCCKVSSEPSLLQAEQPRLPLPVSTGEVLQTSYHPRGPPLGLPSQVRVSLMPGPQRCMGQSVQVQSWCLGTHDRKC